MLSSNLIRVGHRKDDILPRYVDPGDPGLLALAERLLLAFRSSQNERLEDLEEDLDEIAEDGPMLLLFQGLSKVLLDRCEFDTRATLPPEEVRERLFLLSTEHRQAEKWQPGEETHRKPLMEKVAAAMESTVEDVEASLYADLKSQQRLIQFEDLTAERLLHRYNVALAQALLLRSTRVQVLFRKLGVQRCRQLARAAKFHRLIAVWEDQGDESYSLSLDGPLSLFSQTQKYGLQLANFFPHVLHTKQFSMTAHLLWGPEKKPKRLVITQEHELVSHTPDLASYKPAELELFEKSFAKKDGDWKLRAEPNPIPLGGEVWFPDYMLEHTPSGELIALEIVGYWRRVEVDRLYQRLKKEAKTPFLLLLAEDKKVDEDDSPLDPAIVRYKRTPTADLVIDRANALLTRN